MDKLTKLIKDYGEKINSLDVIYDDEFKEKLVDHLAGLPSMEEEIPYTAMPPMIGSVDAQRSMEMDEYKARHARDKLRQQILSEFGGSDE